MTHTQQVSTKYQQNEKHFNYTTPKSFLEFMKLYGNLLGKKCTELTQKMERLENGLQKLQSTASQVKIYPVLMGKLTICFNLLHIIYDHKLSLLRRWRI